MIIKMKYATIVGYGFLGMGSMVVQKWTAPDADAAAVVLAATGLLVTAQTITTGITNPDFPRGLSIKGNAGGIAGDVVITGQNIRGEVITETIALNGSSEVQGSKAFAVVTSILLPAYTNADTDTVSVGINDKLGLQAIPAVTACVAAYQDNTLEGTLPTVTTHATDIESCTADFNTACDASKNMLAIYPTRERVILKGQTS